MLEQMTGSFAGHTSSEVVHERSSEKPGEAVAKSVGRERR